MQTNHAQIMKKYQFKYDICDEKFETFMNTVLEERYSHSLKNNIVTIKHKLIITNVAFICISLINNSVEEFWVKQNHLHFNKLNKLDPRLISRSNGTGCAE